MVTLRPNRVRRLTDRYLVGAHRDALSLFKLSYVNKKQENTFSNCMLYDFFLSCAKLGDVAPNIFTKMCLCLLSLYLTSEFISPLRSYYIS